MQRCNYLGQQEQEAAFGLPKNNKETGNTLKVNGFCWADPSVGFGPPLQRLGEALG